MPATTRKRIAAAEPENGTGTAERILLAAAEVFASIELPTVTMEDIARQAGVSRQTVHAHFRTKDDLVIALLVFTLEHTNMPALRRMAEGTPTVKRLIQMFEKELQLAGKMAFVRRTFGTTFTPRIADLILGSESIGRSRRELWIPILERYRDAGIVRTDIDLERFVHWMTYQNVWLLAHPTALGNDAERRRYLRDFLLGAALRQDL